MEIKIKRDNKLNYYVKLDESETIDGSKVILSGNVLPINSPTVNGHIYTEDVVKEAISKFQQSIENRTWYGSPNLSVGEDCFINVSHLITKLEIRDSALYTEIEILPTPMGEKLRDSINSGNRFNVSVSGYGEIDSDNIICNYQMLTITLYGDLGPDEKV